MSMNYIQDVLQRFYLVTHIPIKAFQANGHHIASFGYDDKLNQLFDNHDIYRRIKTKISENNPDDLLTVSPINNIYYTACPICPRSEYSGLFVIGPFSYKKANSMNIVYKPEFILPHIITTLYNIWRECPNTEPGFPRCQAYNLHVRKAIDYIYDRYSESITLSDISKHLNINKYYFSSMFKKETGKTFTQFLNEVRVEKSKKMLLNDDMSMLDIALSVGFNNQNYFNIIFKKVTNTTPLEFKNSLG